MIDQAAFEFRELAQCAVEDLDDELHDYASEFDTMATQLETLHVELSQSAGRGACSKSLAFMPRVEQLRRIVPFYPLVAAIDSACRRGVGEQ